MGDQFSTGERLVSRKSSMKIIQTLIFIEVGGLWVVCAKGLGINNLFVSSCVKPLNFKVNFQRVYEQDKNVEKGRVCEMYVR